MASDAVANGGIDIYLGGDHRLSIWPKGEDGTLRLQLHLPEGKEVNDKLNGGVGLAYLKDWLNKQ